MIKLNPNKIYVGFHTGKGRKGISNFYGKAIKFFTKGDFVHVELKLPEWISDGKKTSFSSSLEDGGVRFKHINYMKHPERWILLEYPIWNGNGLNEVSERVRNDFIFDLYKNCCKYVGAKYDIKGIFLNQLFGLKYENPDKWWCSEIVSHVLNLPNEKINPSELFNICNSYLRSYVSYFDKKYITIPTCKFSGYKNKKPFLIKAV